MIFNTFPIELQSLIMSYCTPKELCSTVAPICKQWFRLAYDIHIWKVLDFDGYIQEPKDVLKLLRQFRPYRLNLQVYYFNDKIISQYPICYSVVELNLYLCFYNNGCTLHNLANTFPNVRTLIIEKIWYNDIDHRGHWKNLKFIKLKEIDLFNPETNKFLIEFLRQKHECLEEFHYLDCEKFNDDDLKVFVEGQGLNLKQFSIDYTLITPLGYQTLTLCQKITHLTICNPIFITDRELLLILKELKNLTALRIKDSDKLFSEKFKDLFTNIVIPGLVELEITSCTKFDDEALELIVKCSPSLKDLLLSTVDNVSKTGLKSLVQVGSNLESLQLRCIKFVTKKFLTKLSKKLPNIRELITAECPSVSSDQCHIVLNKNHRLVKKKPFIY